MISRNLTLFKILGLIALLMMCGYYSYDYGMTSTQAKAMKKQNALYDKMEQKQDEAYQLAVQLANQKLDVQVAFRTIEKKVIKYAQNNSDKQCVVIDPEWMLIRADSVRAHNRAIGIQQPAPVSDGATPTTAAYQRDTEVLAEDVANIQTCAENAKKLRDLQTWINAQL
ncbi:hypothetical protein [uncultured Vibrio sp.]|uniref:hypothetical protein n=1 Tax=uncultured Vibrio sp. TaxID=114054 RepID=UPI0025CE093F|nr:hypothetical protein [uncultured Vibrio sp.]